MGRPSNQGRSAMGNKIHFLWCLTLADKDMRLCSDVSDDADLLATHDEYHVTLNARFKLWVVGYVEVARQDREGCVVQKRR